MDILKAEGVESTYAVYDKATGEIVNIHHSIILPGANAPSKDDDEASAMRHSARASGRSIIELAIISINPNAIRRGYRYGVDISKKELRELPPRGH
jgi:hypothetical protein